MKYPGPPGNDEVPVGSGRGRSDRGGVGSPKGGGLSEPDFSRSPSGEQDRVEDREGASDPGHHVGPAVGRMAASTSHGLDFSSRDHAGGASSDSSPGTTVRRCWFRTAAEIRRGSVFPDLEESPLWTIYLDDTTIIESVATTVQKTLEGKPARSRNDLGRPTSGGAFQPTHRKPWKGARRQSASGRCLIAKKGC